MKGFYYIAILFLAIGCQSVKYPEKPDNLIPQDKMVQVLTEVYLSNAARTNIRKVRESGYKLDSMLYVKFDIDSSQFAKSHAYYSANIEDYLTMFDNVKLNLEKIRVGADSLKAVYTKRKKIKDSIKKDSLRAEEMKRLGDSLDKKSNRIKPLEKATSLAN
ncbi:hypothetical protein SCB49_08733 [unidentified eubacterium SCB49]|nr:hypothetical protein SCB49_08733 [unidentified eubacterium SCB49]